MRGKINMIFNKIIKVIKNPKKIIIYLASKGIIKYDDEKYLKFVYKEKTGYELNLDNPETFNEKLQWIKLYDRNPQYTNLVDKYEVRKIIEEKIGKEYLIPCLGVYNSVDKIELDKLPNQFVLKTTHDSGTVIICKDKATFDFKNAKKVLKKRLKRKYFYLWREWPYKNVKPRIIVEKYMEDKDTSELRDYKFYCFDGIPKLMFIVKDRGKEPKINFYNMDFKKVELQQCYPNFDEKISKPKQFNEMKELCKILSKDIPHVRVDFYIINGKVYFGELTFFDSAGLDNFTPSKWNKILGDWINLKK